MLIELASPRMELRSSLRRIGIIARLLWQKRADDIFIYVVYFYLLCIFYDLFTHNPLFLSLELLV